MTLAALPAAEGVAGSTLTLQDTIRRTLANNLDLKIRDIHPLIAQDALMRARADFDPAVFAEFTYEDMKRQQNSIEFISTGGLIPQQGRYEEENMRSRAGIGGKLPTGATYELSVSASELDNSVNRTSPSALFRPEYQSQLGMQLIQPLLQNFGPRAALTEIRIAALKVGVSEYERELEITNKLIQVVNAFYDLAFGQENLRVKLEAERSATQLLGDNRRRQSAGRMSPLDVSQAEVKLSEAREEVLLARDFLRERRVILLKLISPSFDATTLPDFTVQPAFEDVVLPEAAVLIVGARSRRPDYLLALDELSISGLRRARARNGALPRLDLKFSYGLNGLDRSWGDTLSRATRANEPQWTAGFAMQAPLGNRAARAEARAAGREERQAGLRLRQVELNLALDVHNALQRLELQRQRLETAGISRRVAEQAYEAETRRLDAGQTTSFNVLQMQDKLSGARTRELAARVDLQKSIAEAWGASGLLFERTGFKLERRADTKAASDSWTPLGTFRRE